LSKSEPSDPRPAYAVTWQSVEAVENYARSRYLHLDQRLISWREQHIIDDYLKDLAGPKQTLLDMPAGYGRFTQFFRKYGFSVINGDLNLYALIYQQRCNLDIRMSVVTNGNCLPFCDNMVDVVFNFRLLQHFKTSAERVTLLKELTRVSRRTLIVSVYLESGFHRLTQVLSGRKRRMTLIARKQWETELQDCGLKVVKMRKPLRFFHAQCIFWLEKTAPNN
jgi:ubiquinone/menaquinone biosynthesis C-methylase UbiE